MADMLNGAERTLSGITDQLSGTAGIASFPNAAVPADDVSMAEVLRSVWAGLMGTAAGENGIATYPAAAAAGNGVSLAEVVRYIQATQIGTLTNSGGTATLGGILGDVANSSVAARLTALAGYVDGLETSVGTLVNTAGTATLGGILGDVANSSIAARLIALAGYVDGLEAAVGTLTNTGGTATIAGIFGDVAGSTVATQLGNLGGRMVSKAITYDGSASYTAFTVTGLVAVKVVGYITTALTNDAATTSVGTTTSAAGLIAATAGTAMQTVNQVWVDDAPTKFETFPANWTMIGDGEDIVVDGDANLVGGVVSLYCWYIPISTGASVVAAA